MPQYDAKALQVAQLVQQRTPAELTILFGSRARGDHDAHSDIDILLLLPELPPYPRRLAAEQAAHAHARAIYGHNVPVEITWDTLASFRRHRHYANSIHTHAVQDGIIMPRHTAEYRPADYEDEPAGRQYDWSHYEARIQDAADALALFQAAHELGLSEAAVGRQAQQALEHGLKALLEAHGAAYRAVHDIGELLGNVRRHDPELRNFRLAIPPEIYSNYAGRRGYLVASHSVPWLSEQDDYIAHTIADARRIIDRARTLRARCE